MKEKLKISILILTTLILFGCPSDDEDDCLKTITIPQFYWMNNQSHSYDITQEVPCDFPEPTDAVQIEPPVLENFSYDVLNFEYISDTGNNTSKLKFEIQINNEKDHAIQGFPILTIESDGLIITGTYSNGMVNPCTKIDANSSCILTYEKEGSLDLGAANSVNLISVKYYLTN